MIAGGNNISGISAPSQIYPTRRAAPAGDARERGGAARFDSVTISAERPASFAAQLTGRLTREVRAAATPGRLTSLREKITSGEYQPDPMSIARRMLLMPEEG